VLVEDSVTGTTPQYYQSNSYSGGSSLIDVDGSDWANKPSNVPASQMVYRHVARGIAPNFNGSPLANTSYNYGDTETLCFEFTLDPSWDLSKIHIVGMLIDNGNMIDNSSSNSIDDAEILGYTPCATTSIGLELNGPDKVNIYPNPATDNIYISNLLEKSIIKIYDIQGKLVLENKISNKEYVNISMLAKGIYQVKFEGNNLNETRKLIIE
ncbi:MAG: T9SS type A sorting domain-containing protein, partial [Flavobacteriales bacterium]|nr:T9SS type A sorting domain-containing protein [Flavobacteriales bacterium]